MNQLKIHTHTHTANSVSDASHKERRWNSAHSTHSVLELGRCWFESELGSTGSWDSVEYSRNCPGISVVERIPERHMSIE